MKIFLRLSFGFITLLFVFFSFVLVSVLFEWAGADEVFAIVLLPIMGGAFYTALGMFCNIYLLRNVERWEAGKAFLLSVVFALLFLLPPLYLLWRMFLFES